MILAALTLAQGASCTALDRTLQSARSLPEQGPRQRRRRSSRACSSIRKIVNCALTPGLHRIRLSRTSAASVRLLVIRQH